MPSERDQIQQIQLHVTRLLQAVAEARFWHDHGWSKGGSNNQALAWEFEQTMRLLNHFGQTSQEFFPFLLKDAKTPDEFLRRRW
jgi:hypothetical protein